MQIDNDNFLHKIIPSAGYLARIYEWESPTISLGISQKTNILAQNKMDLNKCQWVKRITGGKAVLHFREITYSITAPIPSPIFGKSLSSAYIKIAQALIHF